MHPYLFEELFGPVFFLRTYVLLLLTAAVVVYLLLQGPALRLYRAKVGLREAVLDHRRVGELALVVAFFLLLGARIGYVLVYREYYFPDLPRILRIWEGGLVFHGGLAGALVGVFLYARWRGIALLHILDMALPFVPVGYAIGRVGCFLNGCCRGVPADNPWGIAWTGEVFFRHPTQLYSAAAGVGLVLILIPLYRSSRLEGAATAAFFAGMGGYRFVLEFLRVHRPVEGGLSPFQISSLGLIAVAMVVGIVMIVRRSLYRRI